jgi:hypothetical protein
MSNWGRGFYKGGDVSGMDSVLADMQARKERERAMTAQQQAQAEALRSQYLSSLMQGLSPERRAQVLAENGVTDVKMPQFTPTSAERIAQLGADDTLAAWEKDPQNRGLAHGGLEAGRYQNVYGAAAPTQVVDAGIAGSVYGDENVDPNMVKRQKIGDKIDMTGKEAAEHPTWVIVEKAKANASNASADASRASATANRAQAGLYGEQTTNERDKRNPNSPVSPGYAQSPGGANSAYQDEKRESMSAIVDNLLTRIGPMTTGYGSWLANLPETDARAMAGDLNSLKGNIAFAELQAMRNASKTGGALGAVSERELKLLESSLGSLDQGHGENLRANLEKIKASLERWEAAKGQQGGGDGVQTTPDGKRWRRVAGGWEEVRTGATGSF